VNARDNFRRGDRAALRLVTKANHSHAGDDWKTCRDFVRARLGLSPFKPGNAPRRSTPPRAAKARDDEVSDKRKTAKWLWEGRELITNGCPV
jgi:hypothetical protein